MPTCLLARATDLVAPRRKLFGIAIIIVLSSISPFLRLFLLKGVLPEEYKDRVERRVKENVSFEV